ncbi:response regulator transcription factor [Acutalibacter sp. 1XD8-36]|uniref:response regulator transcription factor n=1 Tax=Acutalibacter sp. 1XD8-36 TaxID=2320852 RepID=UPI001412627B|nr:response regulator transcription factor [Acutalibacter sp. 1XD8-36]
MYTAMVVDDEPLILKGFEKVIPWEEFGIEITDKAESGEQALELLRKKETDILITDIRMQGMSGLELLRNLRELGMHIKTIILSGYDDFQYVKEASQYGIENYLLKPIEESELEETLRHLTQKLDNERRQQASVQESYQLLRNNILSRWVSGTISEEELAARAEFLGFPIDMEWYQAAILQPAPSKHRGDSAGIYSVLQEAGMENLIAFVNWQGQGVLLFCWDGEAGNMAQLDRQVKRCQEALSRALRLKVFVAVAAPRRGWEGAAEGFREAEKLLEYRLVLPPDSVVFEEHIRHEMDGSAVETDFKQLDNFIQAGDVSGAKAFLRDTFGGISLSAAPETIHILAGEILLRMSKDFEGGRKQLFAGYLKEIFSLVDMEQLLARLEECVEMVAGWRQSFYRDKNPVVAAVVSYIRTHYSEEISLKTLAQKYRMNAAYLGQLFKSEVGEMFSEYLCRVRIEGAQELLRTTSLRSHEIAKKVGFGSANYFSNTFKKITGQYPSEYRMMFHVSDEA